MFGQMLETPLPTLLFQDGSPQIELVSCLPAEPRLVWKAKARKVCAHCLDLLWSLGQIEEKSHPEAIRNNQNQNGNRSGEMEGDFQGTLVTGHFATIGFDLSAIQRFNATVRPFSSAQEGREVEGPVIAWLRQCGVTEHRNA